MTFAEFHERVLPGRSPFDRRDYDWFTNLVKWLSLRVAFVLARMGVSANLLDVVALFAVLGGFCLMWRATLGDTLWPLVGVALLYVHVFVDFLDGAIAKGMGVASTLGLYLDDLGCDLDRSAIMILCGIFTESPALILISAFAVGVLVRLAPLTRNELPTTGLVGAIVRIYFHRYSFLSVRTMLLIFPAGFALAVLGHWNLHIIGWCFSLWYASAAAVWLLLCIPTYAKRPAL